MSTTACDDQFNDPPIETSETDARPYVGGTPENIRAGDPYDDPAFERLAREHDVWGRAESALCAVFWLAGKAQPSSGQRAGRAGAPDRIFLVISEDIPKDTPFSQLAEVTWCADRVNDTDIEYVRAQPAAATAFTMDDALAAGDGTLHGAIDYWQGRALKAGTETEGLRAHVALLRASLAQAEREADELRAALAAPVAPHLNVTLEQAALALEREGMTESMRIVRGMKIPNDGRITAQAAPQAGEDALKRRAASYIADLEDTLNQIADAMQVERGRPEALIAACKARGEDVRPVAWLHDDPNRVDVIHTKVKDLLVKSRDAAGHLHRPLDKSEHYTIPLYATPQPAALAAAAVPWPMPEAQWADLRRKIMGAPRRQIEVAPGIYASYLSQDAVADILDALITRQPTVPTWPRVFGVSRDMHPRCLVLSLAAKPTDDQVRAIHAALTAQGESHAD